jgi:HK97 family phage major capsid protein
MTDTSRLVELDTALKVKVAANEEIANAIPFEDNTLIVSDEHMAEFQKNMADIREIKGLRDDLNVMNEIASFDPEAAEAARESVAAQLAAKSADFGTVSERRFGSIGEAFIQSDEFKSLAGGANGLTMAKSFELASAGLSVKDVYSDMPTGDPGEFGGVQREPLVQSPKRTQRVRDLFPARQTNAAVIEYFKQTGFTNNASVVPEREGGNFGLKPQSTMTFVGEQAPVRTIAHWEAAHRNVLADEPQLSSIIDNELLYGLRLHEDYQILQGAGTGEDLAGILNNADRQTYSWSAGATTPVADNKADAIRRALTLSFLAFYEPTGVVVHPNDWEDIELTKDSNGQYLMAVNIQQGAQARVWRLPVIDTPAMPEGTALVGAFGTGAQLYDREAPTIRVAEQHSDFFVRNAVVVLAEQRLALAVKRPEAFVDVSFDAAPS